MIEPNYQRSAEKAAEASARFGACSSPCDLLQIFSMLPNVSVVSISVDSVPGREAWDAFSCVRPHDGGFQYIVIYNRLLSPSVLAFALARELGHVILEHDGLAPERVWMEEAVCFARNLLSSSVPAVVVYFRPEHQILTMSFKSMQTFDSLDALKRSVAYEQTRRSRFVGRNAVYLPCDVEIRCLDEEDVFGGWKNYSSVVVVGRTVGYCGE